MSHSWKSLLHIDPISTLLTLDDPALIYIIRRELQDEIVPAIETLWELPEPRRLVAKQKSNGAWRYPGKSSDPVSNTNYDLLETYRTLRVLVEVYGFQREHPALQKAAGYCFSCQTEEGDIRGILGNQYIPYYHGAILELLIKAGYAEDPRTRKGLEWLLAMRQHDGGWIVPAQLVPAKQKTSELWHGAPVQPDRTRPHSHLATGMVLRAFAAHPAYLQRQEVLVAGEGLKERLFQTDKYNDRKEPEYWLKFQFPFWWTSLVTALDTLSRLGFNQEDEHIAGGLDWFTENQSPHGLWDTGYGYGKRSAENRTWVGLAICRVLKRFSEKE